MAGTSRTQQASFAEGRRFCSLVGEDKKVYRLVREARAKTHPGFAPLLSNKMSRYAGGAIV
jgi:hypothetical protein